MSRRLVIYFYAEPTARTLDLSQLSAYLQSLFPRLKVRRRDSFISGYLSTLPPQEREKAISQLAEEIAQAKVRKPFQQHQGIPPLYGEIQYERRRLANPSWASFGILYDGFKMMTLFRKLISPEERTLEHLHITFTNQLLGTWEEGDRRYHARVSIYGFPSFLSTTGIVEAPAKPREYYFLKQQFHSLGMTDAAAVKLDEEFRGRFIDHQDSRLTEVMKGYVMQVVFYHLTGDPFCEDKDCRLFNAHWQEEVIRSQLGKNKNDFCLFHQEILAQLKESIE